MKPLSRQLLIIFLISLFAWGLWAFTGLKDKQLPTLAGFNAHGGHYIVTIYTYLSFFFILSANIKTEFNDLISLRWLLAGSVLLLFWHIAYYLIRLVMIMFAWMIMGVDKSIWDFTAADLIIYTPLVVPVGFIIFSIIHIRQLKRRARAENENGERRAKAKSAM